MFVVTLVGSRATHTALGICQWLLDSMCLPALGSLKLEWCGQSVVASWRPAANPQPKRSTNSAPGFFHCLAAHGTTLFGVGKMRENALLGLGDITYVSPSQRCAPQPQHFTGLS